MCLTPFRPWRGRDSPRLSWDLQELSRSLRKLARTCSEPMKSGTSAPNQVRHEPGALAASAPARLRRLAGAYFIERARATGSARSRSRSSSSTMTGSPIATAGLFVAMQFVPALTTPLLIARIDALEPPPRPRASLRGGGARVLRAGGPRHRRDVRARRGARHRRRRRHAGDRGARPLARGGRGRSSSRPGFCARATRILNIGFTAGAAAGPGARGPAGRHGRRPGRAARGRGLVRGGGGPARDLERPRRAAQATSRRQVAWTDAAAAAGSTYVRERPVLRRLLARRRIAFVFFALVLPIEVAFAKETLDAGDLGYGLLLAAWGAGMVLGSLIFSSLRGASLRVASGRRHRSRSGSPTLGTALAPTLAGRVRRLGRSVASGNGVQWVAVDHGDPGAHRSRPTRRASSASSNRSPAGSRASASSSAARSPRSLSPRASYAVAGIGVLAVLALAVVRPARHALGARARSATRRRAEPGLKRPRSARADPGRGARVGPDLGRDRVLLGRRGLVREALAAVERARSRAGSGRRRRRRSWG